MFNMHLVLGLLRMIIFISCRMILFILAAYLESDMAKVVSLVTALQPMVGISLLHPITIFNSTQIMQIDRFIRVLDGFCIVERIHIHVEKNKKKGVVSIITSLVIILSCYFLASDKVCIAKKKKISDPIINNICWK